jgi:hypothetical protein
MIIARSIEEVSMTTVRVVLTASVAFVLGVQPLLAQELSRYREYALESSVASVVTISGAREADTKTPHERPAKIQELEWRAPYVRAGSELADPVHDLLFSFYDDQLYQVVVTYDRERMEGLTNDDVIESLSATYGLPLLQARSRTLLVDVPVPAETTIVARWEDTSSLLILTRGTYSPQYRLALISKTLNARAQAAIKEALRLDAQEAPQRELDQRKKEIADARVASQKARESNKAAFRP